jgi:hypothetical protein
MRVIVKNDIPKKKKSNQHLLPLEHNTVVLVRQTKLSYLFNSGGVILVKWEMEVVTRFNQAEAKHTHTQTPGTYTITI